MIPSLHLLVSLLPTFSPLPTSPPRMSTQIFEEFAKKLQLMYLRETGGGDLASPKPGHSPLSSSPFKEIGENYIHIRARKHSRESLIEICVELL